MFSPTNIKAPILLCNSSFKCTRWRGNVRIYSRILGLLEPTEMSMRGRGWVHVSYGISFEPSTSHNVCYDRPPRLSNMLPVKLQLQPLHTYFHAAQHKTRFPFLAARFCAPRLTWLENVEKVLVFVAKMSFVIFPRWRPCGMRRAHIALYDILSELSNEI